MEPQRVDRRAEDPDGEVHEMEQEAEEQAHDRAPHRARHPVGYNGKHHARRAERHDTGVRQNVAKC